MNRFSMSQIIREIHIKTPVDIISFYWVLSKIQNIASIGKYVTKRNLYNVIGNVKCTAYGKQNGGSLKYKNQLSGVLAILLLVYIQRK
jgi:hypothetical protein